MIEQQIRSTVNESMTSAISLLYPIALMNNDTNLQQVFFDVENGIAMSGFRRQVANFGVMLVLAHYGRNNEVEIGKNDYKRMNGSYNYLRKGEYLEGDFGLMGGDMQNGERERVNYDIAAKKIEAIRGKVELRYEVDLSPNTLYKFMESKKSRDGLINKKFNMQFTAGLPAGTALGVAERTPEGICMVTKVPTRGGHKMMTSYVDKTSVVSINKIQPGRVYLIKPASIHPETGRRSVNVLRTYKKGVRTAIQHFQMGLIRPGDPGYDVNPNPTNGIQEDYVMDMPFMKTQNPKMIAGAQMLTFDADMIYSLMKTLSGYPVVTMKFKDPSSGVYFVAEGNEYLPNIEAIVGPTIQYVRGRVWLP